MGMWNMTVLGTGCHHNFKQKALEEGDPNPHNWPLGTKVLVPDGKGGYERTVESDADAMFKEFVEKLKAAGHSISHASFTHGGREDI